MQIGDSVGPYSILGKIGEGGMGEVYRARDTQLNRSVAIKVLPGTFAVDAERLARFTREAQTLAALNHPNIAHLYGLESSGGSSKALVMELVDGEDLSILIARGPLPVDDAVAIARQIADALEAAHDLGIIHRDLKPANIKVRPDGTVKVLDFGLAKAVTSDNSGLSDPLHSPTFTARNTQMGTILGTAAYMSPEQARGYAVDRRTDIWAFGAVLFEMLTGRRAFGGDTVTDTLAAVIAHRPDLSALPSSTPPAVRGLLDRCLERDVKRRLQAIGEARIILEQPAPVQPAIAGVQPPRSSAGVSRVAPWILAAAAVTFAAFPLTKAGPAAAPPQVKYLDISLPPDIEPLPVLESGFNISPDGQLVVITGVREGARRLHVRRLATEGFFDLGESSTGVTSSAFSPDSRRIAYLGNNGQLLAVTLADNQRTVLSRGADLAGGVAWGDPGVVFSRNGALFIVQADASDERRLTTLDAARNEVFHAAPAFSPDGRFVLFTSFSSDAGGERIEAVPVTGGERRVVLDRAVTPIVTPTGHFLFGRDNTILGSSFDWKELRLTGEAVTVLPKGQVATTASGSFGVRVARSGDMLLLPDGYQSKQLASVGRDGSTRPFPFPPARYMNPRLSPDGRRVSLEAAGLRMDVLDLERQTVTRLTADAPGTLFSTWMADGRSMIFRRYNAPYWLATDGSSHGGRVPDGVSNDYPSGAGPDPDSFLSTRIGPQGAGDILLVSRSDRFEPRTLLATPAYEGGAQLSPDKRWMVYVTTASGQSEIQLRRYPSLERAWQVSAGYGVQPRWSFDGREIFFRDGKHMVSVTFDGGRAEPVIGRPTLLFLDEYDLGQGITIANYDVTKDGRFLMLRRTSAAAAVRIVLNWTEQLKAQLAAGTR